MTQRDRDKELEKGGRGIWLLLGIGKCHGLGLIDTNEMRFLSTLV